MKPHIKKVNGVWECDGFTSLSPSMAYDLWKSWAGIEDALADYIIRGSKPHGLSSYHDLPKCGTFKYIPQRG